MTGNINKPERRNRTHRKTKITEDQVRLYRKLLEQVTDEMGKSIDFIT